MTAKEKAKELVDRFYFNGIEEIEYSMQYEDGIQCALICVDEILEVESNSIYSNCLEVGYWEEVKQEIEKL
jgi:hypothetical protein